jgi:uncharacterized membrane protein
MTMASSMQGSTPMPVARTSRWLVLISLALNLFFVGVAGALVARNYLSTPVLVAVPDRSVASRIDRLAATLPPADAEKLRAEFRARLATVEPAREAYRRAQDTTRDILRTEPFDIGALRAAMAQARAARLVLDEALHGVVAAAAAQMSPAGREKLADWPPGSRGEPNR